MAVMHCRVLYLKDITRTNITKSTGFSSISSIKSLSGSKLRLSDTVHGPDATITEQGDLLILFILLLLLPILNG